MTRRGLVGLGVVVGLVVLASRPPSGGATSLIAKRPRDLITEATRILHAKVVQLHSVPSPRGWTSYTYVSFQPVEALKGSLPDGPFLLRLEGDQTGPYSLPIPSMPRFHVHDDCLLFIRSMHDRACPLVGWEQGLLTMRRDATGRELVMDGIGRVVLDVTPDGVNTLPLPDPGDPAMLPDAATLAAHPPMSLADFLRRIHAMVNDAPPQPAPEEAVITAEAEFPPVEEDWLTPAAPQPQPTATSTPEPRP